MKTSNFKLYICSIITSDANFLTSF